MKGKPMIGIKRIKPTKERKKKKTGQGIKSSDALIEIDKNRKKKKEEDKKNKKKRQ